MRIIKPIIAGAVGTSFMTIFSYAYSSLKGKQFREPELLAHLLEGTKAPENRAEYLKGWATHYLVGSAFSLSYEAFLKGKAAKPQLKSLVYGGLFGLLGVVGWKATFSLHPSPPKTDYNEYYRHLIIAHLIFGYFAFSMLEKGND